MFGQIAGQGLALVAAIAIAAAAPAVAHGPTERVSVGPGGAQSNGASSEKPAISVGGRFVAFASEASNLVPGDTNGIGDVFVHDRRAGKTTRVSVSSRGVQGNAPSIHAEISADGRFVAFRSDATNLVPGDTNGAQDVFVHDRKTGRTTRVSVSSRGAQSDGVSWWVLISGNGRFVAFSSWATNLVPNDTNGVLDVFVHNRRTGRTTRVSVSSRGAQANGDSFAHAISADGRFVAFGSDANNLVPGDTNDTGDVFVHDRWTGRTTRVNVGPGHAQANGLSLGPALSPGGRFVAFPSEASNLVQGDTNGVSDIFVHTLAPAPP